MHASILRRYRYDLSGQLFRNLYNSVPDKHRSDFHGECGEADTLIKIATENNTDTIEKLATLTNGASVETLRNDGKPLPCCSSCGHVVSALGIRDKKDR